MSLHSEASITSTSSDPAKHSFIIRDLATKSVILYPTRAHVTREINDVALRPGANEVEIYGLSPTVDENSIQVEGKGSATIVDMMVELVPNNDIFEELYPEDVESEADEAESDCSDEDEAVAAIVEEIESLKLQVTEAVERQNSATERLRTLDRYSLSVTAEHNSPEQITQLLKKYEEDRAATFKAHLEAAQGIAKLKKQIVKKEEEEFKAGKEGRKKKARLARQRAKERKQRSLKQTEKRKAASHIKQERLRYFPKKVVKVTLLLEGTAMDTPGSSRRNSIDSITLSGQEQTGSTNAGKRNSTTTETQVSLLLSYVTKEAGWSPRYDVRVSSLQKTAAIIYRTEFLNRTSETWKDTKLSFSTSQTSYQGLDDVVPNMHPWHLKLSKSDFGNGGLLSKEEVQTSRFRRPVVAPTFNRSQHFGLGDNFIPVMQSHRPLQMQAMKPNVFGNNNHNKPAGTSLFGNVGVQKQSGGFGATANVSNTNVGGLFGPRPAANVSQAGGLFGQSANNSNTGGGLFGQQSQSFASASGTTVPPPPPPSNPFGASNPAPAATYPDEDVEKPLPDEDQADIDSEPVLEFEESSWEDSGLTATYDVPGTRTLAPSSMTRRHKIVSLKATNVTLSHICVPKLRSAAFLRAKIRNPSPSVTLLKGSAGVTLDGSFLGNMVLPRVSPSQTFDLPMGVDSSIHISYPKPTVHRSTQGLMFNKESAEVYARSIWLNNTKPQPVDILVIDQVPVSEDERLKIFLTMPKGLSKEGDCVKTGVSAKEGSVGAAEAGKGGAWGKASAKLKKNGQISWLVNLEKGMGCLLKLEYEARLPTAEVLVPAN